MCRQERMASEIYGKTISWRGRSNIINRQKQSPVAGYISHEPSNGIRFIELTATHLMTFFFFFFPLNTVGLFFSPQTSL